MEDLKIKINGKEVNVKVEETEDNKLNVYTGGEKYEIEVEPSAEDKDMEMLASSSNAATGEIKAPIPGVISNIAVKEGDDVKKEQKLLSFMAMKMENEIKAPIDGKVKKINVKANSSFNKGDVLLVIE